MTALGIISLLLLALAGLITPTTARAVNAGKLTPFTPQLLDALTETFNNKSIPESELTDHLKEMVAGTELEKFFLTGDDELIATSSWHSGVTCNTNSNSPVNMDVFFASLLLNDDGWCKQNPLYECTGCTIFQTADVDLCGHPGKWELPHKEIANLVLKTASGCIQKFGNTYRSSGANIFAPPDYQWMPIPGMVKVSRAKN